MNLGELASICQSIYGIRGGDGSQEATGAAGHVKAYPINGNGRKTLFLARQGGPMAGPLWTVKVGRDNPMLLKFKLRDVDDCRAGVITFRKKGEWVGYHAEMIIVSRWIKLLFPATTADTLTGRTAQAYQTAFAAHNFLIVANAPCCKHCHNMLTYLGIAHPVPNPIKHSLTGWWNPLTDERFANSSEAFGNAIPGL